MAGNRNPMGRRLLLRSVAVVAGLAIGGVLCGSAAQAQVPPVPDVPPVPGVPGVPGVPSVPPPPVGVPDVPPDIPAPVADAIEEAEDTVIPVLVDASIQGQAVSKAAGFALRPPCSVAGTVVLLVAIGGGALPLPVSTGVIATPLLIFCAGAYEPGPADPVFKQVDTAVGPTLQSNVQPVLTQAGDALAPVRPQLLTVCGAIALTGSSHRQVPPPLSRFNIVKEVCTP